MGTSNSKPLSGGSPGLPVPKVIILDRPLNGVISNFDGTTVVNWFNQLAVRMPDAPTEAFTADSEPLLELCWSRASRKKENFNSAATKRRWSFPDDPLFRYGSNMGGGQQQTDGDIPALRRSKWSLIGIRDGDLIGGGRIELEHYYRAGEIRYVFGVDVLGFPETASVNGLRPTFLKTRIAQQPPGFTMSRPLSRVPKYKGYEHGYFAFAFSIKDPNGLHPGDRVTGPLSPIVKVILATESRAFPLRYNADGFMAGVDGTHLRMELT